MTFNLASAAAAMVIATAASASGAATLVASYSFADTLAADQASAPALVSVDPLGLNGFETALVNGTSQRVFRFAGSGNAAANNGGLQLDTTGLLAYDNYSVQMTFAFDQDASFGGGWRRIIDTQNRQSDNGFYVDPGKRLQVYPVVTGTTLFTNDVFHTVVLSNFVVNGTKEVKAYLDGNLELVSNTDQLNLDNANNPGHLLSLFLDNVASNAQQEYANGRIASLKVYDGIFVPPAVPEPATVALMLVGVLTVAGAARRKRN